MTLEDHHVVANGHAFSRGNDALKHAQDRVSQLEVALEHRTIISAALGMLMERYSLDYDRAFAALSRESQQTNVKLFELAQQLFTTGHTGTL